MTVFPVYDLAVRPPRESTATRKGDGGYKGSKGRWTEGVYQSIGQARLIGRYEDGLFAGRLYMRAA